MMPAGKYYVGDLCYVMDPEWDEVCSLIIEDRKIIEGEFNLGDGRRFVSYSTKYGDGCYEDQLGHEYGVDAGLIGCIRVEDISEDMSEKEMKRLGNVVEFKQPFHCYGGRTEDWNGVIRIGHLNIYTG